METVGKFALALIVLLLLLTNMSYAQDTDAATHQLSLTVDGVALLAIPTGDIELKLKAPTVAGAMMEEVAENSDTRLRISSLPETDDGRSVTVKISQDLTVTELSVQALPPITANFVGTTGDYADKIVLSTIDKPILSNIHTCWSGTDENDGYVIKYFFRLKPLAANEDVRIVEKVTIKVTFTLSETL